MNKNVTIIPPSEGRPAILRVAAYCRVSTDSDDQATSYASQIRSYTELISQHEGWELVDIYADEAVSGTKTDKREDFNRLLADCRKGKIDRVLVKSISRFSRNTKDCLAALRELMRLGVTVQFEKENIDTGTLTTELMVSVSGSLAQQESMSISQNIHQSYRRRMERGEFITTKPPYGYRLVNRRDLEIVPEEAEIIRWVFDAYLGGQSAKDIANELIRRGVRDRKGNVHWTTREIYYWLSNEKYVGDTLCQKTYKTGFPFVQKINRGEVDQFYVEGTHPAIVSQEVYDKAQALRQMKKKQSKGPDAVYPLSRKMCCGICGFTIYRRMTRRGTGAWSCGRHLRSAANCPTGPIPEEDIYAAFLRMYNKLRLHDGIILRPALGQMEALETAVQRDNPAMLEVNRAIAQATERGYKISKLRTNGLAVVSRIFTLCLEGKFQWEISDILNAEGIQYSPDCPAWTKFKISLTLRNQRYAGADGYPILIGSETFQSVQALLQKKWGKHIHRDRPVSALRETLRCPCGGRLKRWFSSVHRPDTLYLRCAECGGEAVIPDAELLAEVERQAAEYTPPAEGGYTPSEDTVRLTNAINRGLERPEHPEDVVALILRGISARYACFEAPAASPDTQRLIRVKAYAQAIKYITITAENAVTVTFK